jgi:hypothetical protein
MRQLANEMDAVRQCAEVMDEARVAQLAFLDQRFDEHWQRFNAEWKQLEERLQEEAQANAATSANLQESVRDEGNGF